MKSPFLFLVVLWLAAVELFAQPAAAFTPDKVLPASSLYGVALLKTNIPYVNAPAPRQNFDLILPTNRTAQPFPLVVWMHGGAWMSGSKDWINVKYLVKHGYAIASVDYRLTPGAPFPAQIRDCNAALDFILAHATNYGVSAQRFVVAGGSAGGHLALLLGLARDEKEFGADPAVKPLAVLDFFGPTDFARMKSDLEAEQSEAGLKLYADAGPKLLGALPEQVPDKVRLASPMTYVGSNNPPVLIVQGGRDNLVPAAQSERLHAALNAVGVKSQLILVPAAGHDGSMFSTPQVAAQVVQFLEAVMPTP